MDGGDRWGDREYSSPNQGGPPLPGKSSACVVATSIKHMYMYCMDYIILLCGLLPWSTVRVVRCM